ncbi:class I SAM-dependent methyltransferase [Mycobacterium sp. B14F4]|uniref:class I SAM-dependent methyltransferase n=1 Tax=Mycobacterium sp. B14F4 TaxID=3153565 RepID=UPI00325E1417
MALNSLSVALAGARLAVTRPFELVDRIEGKREVRRMGPHVDVAGARADVYDAIHELCGVSACFTCAEEIAAMTAEVNARLPREHLHDGGNTLAQSLWILIRHRKPAKIVETGVARGISSAFQLGALAANGEGQLWSIDLPPVRGDWQVETGSAVPDRLKGRWTYIRSSSRRALPPLLADLRTIDIFVHDGLHTAETMTFEFHHVWPYLKDDGVLVADDADANPAFVEFCQRAGLEALPLIEVDKGSVVGVVNKK